MKTKNKFVKEIIITLIMIASIIDNSKVFSQQLPTGAPGNSNNWFRGGNNVTGGENILGTNWESPIYFITGATTSNKGKMVLMGNTPSGTSGFLSISDFAITTPFFPQSLIHLNQSSTTATLWQQFTNGNTGGTANDGLRIGMEYNSGYISGANSFAKFIQQENAPMKFYTGTGSGISDRMIINSNYSPMIHSVAVTADGYIGIGTNPFWNEETGGEGPRSLLHLQGPSNVTSVPGGDGWRGWMKRGVYISENSDEMYVGLKDESTPDGINRSDAVIAWADDQGGFADGTADNFRLIFSGAYSSGSGNGGGTTDPRRYDGMEILRATPFGKVGIGPLFTSVAPPARRLELLDYTGGASEAQLRITHTQASSSLLTTTGKWVDMQATSLGDLYINPKDATNERRVGVNIAAPGNTVEIKSPGITVSNGGAGSGLMFTNMNNTVNPQPNPDPEKGVLSVDNLGNVIFVDGASGAGNVSVCPTFTTNACHTATIVTDYLSKFSNPTGTEICNTFIAESSAPLTLGNIGIGTNNFLTSSKLRLVTPGDVCIDNRIGIYVTNNTTVFPADHYGIRAEAINNTTLGGGDNIGGYFNAHGRAATNWGVLSWGGDPTGVYPSCTGCINYGGSFNARGAFDGGGWNIGVEGFVDYSASSNISSTATNVGGKFYAGTGSGGPSTSAGQLYGVLAAASGALPALTNGTVMGIKSEATNGKTDNYAGYFAARNATDGSGTWTLRNHAVHAVATGLQNGVNTQNYGGYFEAFYNGGNGGADCRGVHAVASIGTITTYGVYANSNANNTGLRSHGVHAEATSGVNETYGVFASSAGGPFSHAVHAEALNGQTNGYGVFASAANAPNAHGVHTSATSSAGSLTTYGVHSTSTGGPDSRGVHAVATNGTTTTYGVFASASSISSADNHAVHAEALNGQTNGFGVYATSNGGTNSHAVHAKSQSGTNSIGVHAEATSGSTTTYGVWASGGTGCTPTVCPVAAGFFSGDVSNTANIISSDRKLKENIQPVSNASDILSKLNPVTYNFRTDEFPSMHLGDQRNFGFIAQEVAELLPELTKQLAEPSVTDGKGNTVYEKIDFLGLNYDGIIPILVKGFQEQQAVIEDLKAQLNNIAPQNTGSRINYSTIELKSESAFLYQNEPNPFDNSTVIRYYIPDNSNSARIIFMDETGKIINETVIAEKGMGSLNVISSELNSGIYTYSLEVDSKILDTKKMLKAK